MAAAALDADELLELDIEELLELEEMEELRELDEMEELLELELLELDDKEELLLELLELDTTAAWLEDAGTTTTGVELDAAEMAAALLTTATTEETVLELDLDELERLEDTAVLELSPITVAVLLFTDTSGLSLTVGSSID